MPFTTSAGTVAGRNLSRDNRVALTADDPVPPYSFVLIEGTAELSSDPGELLALATRLGGRYMGPERATEFGQRNAVPGELIVAVTRPASWLSATSRTERPPGGGPCLLMPRSMPLKHYPAPVFRHQFCATAKRESTAYAHGQVSATGPRICPRRHCAFRYYWRSYLPGTP